MAYLFNEEEITSVADLLAWLRADEDRLCEALKPKRRSKQRHFKEYPSKPTIWYRGLKDITYELVPTFYRPECKVKINDEIYLMNLFKQNSHELLSQIPSSEWEWMFLMRHHNAPSRLLDWTENPLVGLYFAVCPGEHDPMPKIDGVLWCLLPNRLNFISLKWPPDDNTLPMLTSNRDEFPRGENEPIPLYLPSAMKSLTISETLLPVAGMSPRTNRRMQVQMGVFTVHHADKTPIEAAGDSTHIWRYRIPYDYKEPIYQELKRIGLKERTLFPSLDNVARETEEVLGGD